TVPTVPSTIHRDLTTCNGSFHRRLSNIPQLSPDHFSIDLRHFQPCQSSVDDYSRSKWNSRGGAANWRLRLPGSDTTSLLHRPDSASGQCGKRAGVDNWDCVSLSFRYCRCS